MHAPLAACSGAPPLQQATDAAEGGGAVACFSNRGFFTIVGCTFIGNTASNGGGIMVDNTPVDTVGSYWGGTMLGCYFESNWANKTGAGRGGAIFCEFLESSSA